MYKYHDTQVTGNDMSKVPVRAGTILVVTSLTFSIATIIIATYFVTVSVTHDLYILLPMPALLYVVSAWMLGDAIDELYFDGSEMLGSGIYTRRPYFDEWEQENL